MMFGLSVQAGPGGGGGVHPGGEGGPGGFGGAFDPSPDTHGPVYMPSTLFENRLQWVAFHFVHALQLFVLEQFPQHSVALDTLSVGPMRCPLS